MEPVTSISPDDLVPAAERAAGATKAGGVAVANPRELGALGLVPRGKRRQRAEGTLRQRRERCRPDRRRGSRGRGRRCRRARGRVLALDGRRDKLIVQNLNLQIVEIVHRA